MNDDAVIEYKGRIFTVTSLQQLCAVTRVFWETVYEPEYANYVTTEWMTFIVERIRQDGNSSILHGHVHTQPPGVEWDSCIICANGTMRIGDLRAMYDAIAQMFAVLGIK
jgi:hypothetical protein